jgi:uncharacterized membrane protein
MATLAILGAFFGLGMIFPVKSFVAAEVLGGVLAALAGAVIGTLHGWRLRKKFGHSPGAAS